MLRPFHRGETEAPRLRWRAGCHEGGKEGSASGRFKSCLCSLGPPPPRPTPGRHPCSCWRCSTCYKALEEPKAWPSLKCQALELHWTPSLELPGRQEPPLVGLQSAFPYANPLSLQLHPTRMRSLSPELN